MSDELAQNMLEYIDQRKQQKLDKNFKEEAARLKKASNELDVAATKDEFRQKESAIQKEFTPKTWLTDAAKRAGQISLATHALKFTHGDAKGSSLLATTSGEGQEAQQDNGAYVSTSSLRAPVIDIVGNAAALDVAGLLQLECRGASLAQRIGRGDYQDLAVIAEDEAQLAEWVEGFRQALEAKELSSHTLAKQVYFPVGDDSYHILSPLFPTTMMQALHERLSENRYGETAKEIRQAKRNQTYHAAPYVSYPNLAVQRFGGSKPQNISQLNSQRRGRTSLLPSLPPAWHTVKRPPLTQKHIFDIAEVRRRVWLQIKALKYFLLDIQDKDSTKLIRLKRQSLLDDIMDSIIIYAMEVQQLPSGWSGDQACELFLEYRLWLDPHRDETEFQLQRETGQWQQVVSKTFGDWLNRELKDKKLALDAAVSREWRASFGEYLGDIESGRRGMNE